MTFKIYTKKGDDGSTGLIGGKRVSKHHLRVECYGTVDELNSHIGIVRAMCTDDLLLQTLAAVQDCLFIAGSNLASAPDNKMNLPYLSATDITILESEIDRLTELLPELKHFVLPGASVAGSQAHVARCVCRRAERLTVLLAETEQVEMHIIPYLNRLSDFIFTVARYLDMLSGNEEIKWIPRK